jgi:hypothetical protein
MGQQQTAEQEAGANPDSSSDSHGAAGSHKNKSGMSDINNLEQMLIKTMHGNRKDLFAHSLPVSSLSLSLCALFVSADAVSSSRIVYSI